MHHNTKPCTSIAPFVRACVRVAKGTSNHGGFHSHGCHNTRSRCWLGLQYHPFQKIVLSTVLVHIRG